ncbi:hypothetical protein [Pseudonocardia phyllosphaerae]|uniref:hypothetical protein n=1 Tax=Pseudonocardia phyllosphaerae TaxID=3390502 RepID=UPI00397982C0
MSTVWWVVLGLVAWCVVAVGVALVIGRVVRLRDRQGPGPDPADSTGCAGPGDSGGSTRPGGSADGPPPPWPRVAPDDQGPAAPDRRRPDDRI